MERKLMEDLTNTNRTDWEHLPDIELYLDQVISYLSRDQIQGSPEAELTQSMVNNYVKEKLLPRANGKKYNREHLVYLKMINALKQVFNVKEIKELLSTFALEKTPEAMFAAYQSALVQATDRVAAELTDESAEDLAMQFAVQSYVYKMIAKRLLEQATPE